MKLFFRFSKVMGLIVIFVSVVSLACFGDFEVHTIYFRPLDAPPHSEYNIDGWIKGARELYRSEMIRNGFGDKTFNMNTDNSGLDGSWCDHPAIGDAKL